MRRVLLVLAAVVLASCVESDPSTIEGGPSSPTTTLSPPPGADGDAGADAGTPAPGGRADGGAAAPAGPNPPGPRPTDPSAPSAPSPGSGAPGSAARHWLAPDGARQLVVQVITEPGAEPRQSTLDRLVSVLGEVARKPVSAAGGAISGSRSVWSSGDLRAAAEAASFGSPEGTAVVRLLFVGGRSAAGEQVLGVAVSGDVAAVFSDQVEAAATGLVPPSVIERAVATHELGHLLGLVDLVLDTGRDDPEHPGHSTNRRSVMYWAVESSLITDLLAGGPPQEFDQRDLDDLAAIRRG